MKDHVFIFVDPFFFAPPPKADSFVVAFFSLFLSYGVFARCVDFFFFIRLSLSLSLSLSQKSMMALLLFFAAQ